MVIFTNPNMRCKVSVEKNTNMCRFYIKGLNLKLGRDLGSEVSILKCATVNKLVSLFFTVNPSSS